MSGQLNKLKKVLHLSRKGKIITIVLSSFVILILTTILLMKFLPLSNLNAFEKKQNSTRFYDSEGKLIYVLPLSEGLKREYYPLEEIPENLQKIFILAEDKSFKSHPGVSFTSIARAFKQNTSENKTVSGASTITMQLARLISPRTEKAGIGTKLKEMWNALRLELKLSKNQILEYYLNNIPFGNQIEGVASAARNIYSREITELSLAQMIALAVTPRRPAYYSPLVNPEHSYEAAMIIGENIDFHVSKEEWCKLIEPVPYKQELNAPHYINWIVKEAKENNRRIPDKVNLSLNLELNQLLQTKIQEQLDLFADSRITNGAAIAIENATGRIVGWIGNADYFSENSGQVDGVVSKHQSGSSTKPFLYALALENGYKPNQILPDIPKDFGGQNVYVPLNFNNRYNGPQSMRVCLASSLNIPAVDILYHLGVDQYMEFLSKLQFKSLEGTRKSTGLSVALGSNEVTLLELTRAFSIFANDGILRQVNAGDNINALADDRRVLKSDTARIIADFLADRSAQTLGFGNAKVFNTGYPVLFKTGTANQFQDIISLSSTSGYTVGVWMGNLNGETVIKKTGSSIPAYICRVAQDYLTDNGKKTEFCKPFKQPDFYKKMKVCALSGMMPGEFCKAVKREYIENSSGNFDSSYTPCTWHYESNGITKIKYPSEYQHWSSGQNYSGKSKKSSFDGPLQIMYPTDNAVFFLDSTVPSEVQSIKILCCGGTNEETTAFLDGNYLETSRDRQAFKIKLTPGNHNFMIINGEETKSINFTVK